MVPTGKNFQYEEEFVGLCIAAMVLQQKRARGRLFSRLLAKTRKETKRSMLQQKRKGFQHTV